MDLSKTIAEGAADLERGHGGPSATPAARCCSGPRNRPAVEDTARHVAVPSSPMDIVFPFSPLPSCPFCHTEFFILGEFGADRKSQPWALLLSYHSSEAGTVWLTERCHHFP